MYTGYNNNNNNNPICKAPECQKTSVVHVCVQKHHTSAILKIQQSAAEKLSFNIYQ